MVDHTAAGWCPWTASIAEQSSLERLNCVLLKSLTIIPVTADHSAVNDQ